METTADPVAASEPGSTIDDMALDTPTHQDAARARTLRWGSYGTTGMVALAAWVQVLVHVQFYGRISEYCDYPEECLTVWLPKVFRWADLAYFAFVVLVVIAVATVTLRRRYGATLLLCLATLTMTMGYALTPRLHGAPISMSDHGFLVGGPSIPGTYATGISLIVGSAILCTAALFTQLAQRRRAGSSRYDDRAPSARVVE